MVIKKTVETYLPPITVKVTDFKTMYQYMTYLKQLANNVNMPYVDIMLDSTAAVNAYRLL